MLSAEKMRAKREEAARYKQERQNATQEMKRMVRYGIRDCKLLEKEHDNVGWAADRKRKRQRSRRVRR